MPVYIFYINFFSDKYAIVIFPESNEVEVVATNWLDIPNGLCWWPPKRWALITITKGVRSRLTPDETWGKYPALIMYSTGKLICV